MSMMQVDSADYKAIQGRITELENLLKQPVVSLYSRMVKGNQVNPTIVFVGNINAYQFINGMDITADIDSNQVMVDLVFMASLSALPTSMKIQIEVDGQVDERSSITLFPATMGKYIYTAVMVVESTPGKHRYRAMMSSISVTTMTYTDQSRYLRISGMINNRKRYAHGK